MNLERYLFERTLDGNATPQEWRGIGLLQVNEGNKSFVIWGANRYEEGPMHEAVLFEAQQKGIIGREVGVVGGLIIELKEGRAIRIAKDSGTYPGEVDPQAILGFCDQLEDLGINTERIRERFENR